jgi:acetyltransferase-like isoleucine patch superfamily enzyme
MKSFFILIFNMLRDVANYIRTNWALAKLKTANPTSKFYKGVQVINSTFGGFNVLFYDTILINSALGSHTYVQRGSNIFNTEIGKFCSIASDVTIGPGIHKVDGISTHPSFYLKNTPLAKVYSKIDQFEVSKKTVIGNDVWIGEKAIVMDGVKVGTGAIVASGAVVTKDVEPYSIVGGVPAKHIKYRFEQNVRQGLLESKWWNQSEEWLEKNFATFDKPELLIKK